MDILYKCSDVQTVKHATCGVHSLSLPKVESLLKCDIRNANHERVLLVIDRFNLERYTRACCCTRCVSDAAAIALNSLPPHYYAAAECSGNIGSPWVMIELAVAEAIEKVMENPRHEGAKIG